MALLEEVVTVHSGVLHKLLTRLYLHQSVKWVEQGGVVKSGVVVEVTKGFQFAVRVWDGKYEETVLVDFSDVI